MKKKIETTTTSFGELPNRHAKNGNDQKKRILILDNDKAKPNSEAWNFLVRQIGKCGRRDDCIEIIQATTTGGRGDADDGQEENKATIRISEDCCAACLARAKQCPGGAVKIVNLPSNLSTDTTHRYGPNSFKLHGLPMPRPGHVLGLLGCNGIGKSTALKILSGELKPNLGAVAGSGASRTIAPTWEEIIRYYRGSDLQNYLNRLVSGKLRCSTKPQLGAAFVKRHAGKKVGGILSALSGATRHETLVLKLGLSHLLDHEVDTLSGGELQRFAICLCAAADADVYIFDEPSSFLDVKQRLTVAGVIRDLVKDETSSSNPNSRYVIVVEHDLTLLDYVSDYVCNFYGEPGMYGVVTQRSTTANGINEFISGFIKTENLRFRAEPLSFDNVKAPSENFEARNAEYGPVSIGEYCYPTMSKTYCCDPKEATSFSLQIESGSFRDGEIVGLLAQNGSGKTTFTDMISDHFSRSCVGSDNGERRIVSYKRQHVPPYFRKYKGSVGDFLDKYMPWGQTSRLFSLLVKKPLQMDKMANLPVRSLSTGELQRLMICVCLGTPAQLYVIDEPSAYLDSEQRLVVAKVIKRWLVSQQNRPAFVVEHDMVMASALFDKVIVYDGVPGVECTALAPQMPVTGMNCFLRQLNITFYRSRHSKSRPRINKRGSTRDREQKKAGNFFAIEESTDECFVG